MTAAFDTINRRQLIEIYENKTETTQDENRMISKLLHNTKLSIRVNNTDNDDTFDTNTGSPQGDGLSGTNYNVYFENALEEVRTECEAANITPLRDHDYHIRPPDESIYADDEDLIDTDESISKWRRENIIPTLQKHSLMANPDKTEITILKRGEKHEELWRKCKKLGTLLGDQEEIIRRKALATASLSKCLAIWNRNHVKMERKVQIYNSVVRSILLYNCETWAIGKTETKQLNGFHRKQLRIIANIKHPHHISNERIYQKTKCKPICEEIRKRRWQLLGHILRLEPQIPAYKAMMYYFDETGQKFRGRPRTTIVTTINDDISRLLSREPGRANTLKELKTAEDLFQIRVIAQQRDTWKEISKAIQIAAEAEESL
jgi:hypothetical protein